MLTWKILVEIVTNVLHHGITHVVVSVSIRNFLVLCNSICADRQLEAEKKAVQLYRYTNQLMKRATVNLKIRLASWYSAISIRKFQETRGYTMVAICKRFQKYIHKQCSTAHCKLEMFMLISRSGHVIHGKFMNAINFRLLF